ncbi:hypothetical protein AMK16_20425 [Streptomyces sp. CB00455]|nr:hypothetical protein AMK16_20425 [Streptomyces sp. CB00455]
MALAGAALSMTGQAQASDGPVETAAETLTATGTAQAADSVIGDAIPVTKGVGKKINLSGLGGTDGQG